MLSSSIDVFDFEESEDNPSVMLESTSKKKAYCVFYGRLTGVFLTWCVHPTHLSSLYRADKLGVRLNPRSSFFRVAVIKAIVALMRQLLRGIVQYPLVLWDPIPAIVAVTYHSHRPPLVLIALHHPPLHMHTMPRLRVLASPCSPLRVQLLPPHALTIILQTALVLVVQWGLLHPPLRALPPALLPLSMHLKSLT
jgi:hypothetical protein